MPERPPGVVNCAVSEVFLSTSSSPDTKYACVQVCWTCHGHAALPRPGVDVRDLHPSAETDKQGKLTHATNAKVIISMN
jgi:hypothetical protein